MDAILTTGGDIAETVQGQYNSRLRAAMLDRGVSYADLAKVSNANVKTAQRWVYQGRLPRANRAAVIAQYLDIDVNWLWPRVRRIVNPELINLYAHISEVPRTVWTTSAHDARQAIEVVADVVPALPYNLEEILAAKAAEGIRVRLCVSPVVAATLAIKGASTRVNVNTIPIGLYRFDGEMLVWLNRGGFGVDHSAPALHLRQSEQNGVFDFYRAMFTRLWEDGDTMLRNGADWYRPGVWFSPQEEGGEHGRS